MGMCHSDPLGGKKKIVIKHFVDPLTPHQILQEGAGEIGLTGLVIVMYPVMERERERRRA